VKTQNLMSRVKVDEEVLELNERMGGFKKFISRRSKATLGPNTEKQHRCKKVLQKRRRNSKSVSLRRVGNEVI